MGSTSARTELDEGVEEYQRSQRIYSAGDLEQLLLVAGFTSVGHFSCRIRYRVEVSTLVQTFQLVMVLVSIVVGLALTHVLSALGSAVHRFRGHGAPIRLEAIYLLWVGFILIWLVEFWWWELKFQDVAISTYDVYVFSIAYAISLFLLSVILVPHRMSGMVDSYEYFMTGRRWFFGVLIAVQALDLVDTFLKGAEWGLGAGNLGPASVYVGTCVIGIVSERRSVQLVSAVAAFSVRFLYALGELAILGSF